MKQNADQHAQFGVDRYGSILQTSDISKFEMLDRCQSGASILSHFKR